MIYSLIPAKVTSSRLPGKNTFKFMLGDKPLIAYTIRELQFAGIQPFVFTDEESIECTYGANIVKREKSISGLQTTMRETVKAFIDKLKIKSDDTILLTYLTCPFRTAESINKALELFAKTNSNSLQSVTAVDYRPYGLMKQVGEYGYVCLQDQYNYYQKQNTPTLYKANGAIYIFKVSELPHLNNQMFNAHTVGYILDEIQGLDIDTDFDFMVAEKILERKNNERFASKLSSKGNGETEFSSTWDRVHSEHFKTSRT